MLKIVFNNGVSTKTLTVENIFSYTYNAIKTVLKISINSENHDWDEVEELKNCTGRIKVYEVDEDLSEKLVTEYTGYGLGETGFSCNYNVNANKLYDIEMVRESSYEVRLSELEDVVEELLMRSMEEE